MNAWNCADQPQHPLHFRASESHETMAPGKVPQDDCREVESPDFISFLVFPPIPQICLSRSAFSTLQPARTELALFGYSICSPSFKCRLWCRTKVWEFQQHLLTKEEQPITTCQAVIDRRMAAAEPTLAMCRFASFPNCTALGWPGFQPHYSDSV